MQSWLSRYSSVLLVDVGNTSLSFVVIDSSFLGDFGDLGTVPLGNIGGDISELLDDHFLKLKGCIDCVVFASVVPDVDFSIFKYFASFCNVIQVGSRDFAGILRSDIVDLSSVGVDRLCGAYAVMKMKDIWGKHGAKLGFAIDMGTATTVDIVCRDSDGLVHLGGVICPGVDLSYNALLGGAARINDIGLASVGSVIGKCTSDAVSSWAFFGYPSMICGILDRVRRELGVGRECSWSVFSGGCFLSISGGFDGILSGEFEYDAFLVLRGLFWAAIDLGVF